MREAGRGKIVNITSVRAMEHCGRAPVMDYSAAKAGLVNMTEIWPRTAPVINVNAVAPGHIRTDMLISPPDKTRKGMLAGTPVDRFAAPDAAAF